MINESWGYRSYMKSENFVIDLNLNKIINLETSK